MKCQQIKIVKVLPLRSVHKKIAIYWVDKNRNTWFNTEIYKNKKTIQHYRALDDIVNYVKTTCGQTIIDNLGPTIFNSSDYDIKSKIKKIEY